MDKISGVVAGFPVADCPVVVVSDLKKGITATAHCGVAMINNYLPIRTVEALQNMYNSKKEDIYAYIGAMQEMIGLMINICHLLLKIFGNKQVQLNK